MKDNSKLIASAAKQLQEIVSLVERGEIDADALAELVDSADHPTLKAVRLELRRRRLLRTLLPAIEQLVAEEIEVVVFGLDHGVFQQGADGFVEVEAVIISDNPEKLKLAKSILYRASNSTENFLIYGHQEYPAKRYPLEEKKFQVGLRSLGELQAMVAMLPPPTCR